jgi:hypothetical protein
MYTSVYKVCIPDENFVVDTYDYLFDRYGRPAGLALTLVVYVLYQIALAFEG